MKYWQGYASHLRSKGLAYKKGGSSLPPLCVFSSPRVTARFEKQQRLTALHNLTDVGIGVARSIKKRSLPKTAQFDDFSDSILYRKKPSVLMANTQEGSSASWPLTAQPQLLLCVELLEMDCSMQSDQFDQRLT